MTHPAKFIRLFGLLFFFMGLLWLLSIYNRGKYFLPAQERRLTDHNLFNYSHLKNEMQKILKESQNYSLPHPTIVFFWVLIYMELLCSFFYMITGFALLRRYAFGRLLAIVTLVAGAFFKILVISYHFNIALPLQGQFKNKNILISYFVPGEDWTTYVSSVFSGVQFLQSNRVFYIVVYALYLILTLYFFTRPAVIAQFQRAKNE